MSMSGIQGIRTARSDLFRIAIEIGRSNLSRGSSGTAGNQSVRCQNGFLITPTGVSATELTPMSMVKMDMQGRALGDLKPSSEWRFHLDIYAACPDVGAIVHAHAPFCTALSCMMMDIPAFHYMVAVAGGKDIRCSEYATFGTQELSEAALKALAGRKACLLGHHGMIATGATVDKAFKLAEEVEELAEQYWRVLQIGTPRMIPDDEMDRVLKKFQTYGQPQKT